MKDPVQTWADGYGTWHAAVFLYRRSATDAIEIARERIGEQLVQRGTVDTLHFVRSDNFKVRLVEVEPQPNGLTRYEYMEETR